jgi:hypothetical protein
MTTLRDVPTVLTRHGIESGPGGYDLATLEQAIVARGWRHRTEEEALALALTRMLLRATELEPTGRDGRPASGSIPRSHAAHPRIL